MTIETKFDVFDKVWAIYGNTVTEGRVLTINIHTFVTDGNRNTMTTINYKIDINKDIKPVEVREENLFRTKEDLINSL